MIPQNHGQSSLTTFFRTFEFGRLLAQASIRSRTIGVPGTTIIQFLIGLVSTERNLWRWFNEAQQQTLHELSFPDPLAAPTVKFEHPDHPAAPPPHAPRCRLYRRRFAVRPASQSRRGFSV